MKRSAFIIMMVVALAALAACAPGTSFMDGPADLPGDVNGVTDVGNPDSEAEFPKATYVNDEFDVVIEYPYDWTLDFGGTYEARFSSSEDESAVASFMWLAEGDSFDAFLEEVQPDLAGLISVDAPGFESALCKVTSSDIARNMNDWECYYHGVREKGDFVMAFTARLYDGMDGFDITTSDHLVGSPIGSKAVKTRNELGASGPLNSGPVLLKDIIESEKHEITRR